MNDDENLRPQPFTRPESDLSEGNAYRDGTEQLPEHGQQATADGVWIDATDGPVMLP